MSKPHTRLRSHSRCDGEIREEEREETGPIKQHPPIVSCCRRSAGISMSKPHTRLRSQVWPLPPGSSLSGAAAAGLIMSGLNSGAFGSCVRTSTLVVMGDYDAI